MKPRPSWENDIIRWRERRDERARERVVAAVWDLVYSQAVKYSVSMESKGFPMDKEDIAGAMWPHILNAMDETWDPKKGAFTTHIMWVMKTQLSRAVRTNLLIKIPQHLNAAEARKHEEATRCGPMDDMEEGYSEGMSSGEFGINRHQAIKNWGQVRTESFEDELLDRLTGVTDEEEKGEEVLRKLLPRYKEGTRKRRIVELALEGHTRKKAQELMGMAHNRKLFGAFMSQIRDDMERWGYV